MTQSYFDEELVYTFSIARFRILRRDAAACPACEHWSILISPSGSTEGEIHSVTNAEASGSKGYEHTVAATQDGSPDRDVKIHPLFKFLPLSLPGIRDSIASVSIPPPRSLPESEGLESRGSQDWVVECLRTLEDDYGGAFVTINQVEWWEDMRSRVEVGRLAGEHFSMK
ncbi:hypothetical protein RQP46_009877 [Phenoliferia psychrophenolica]